MKILARHIVPIVRAVQAGAAWKVIRLYGTAFFINEGGAFVTAAHVLKNAYGDQKRDGDVMLACIDERVPPFLEGRAISEWSVAEEPIDVAVGTTGQLVSAAFKACGRRSKLSMWTDVWTAGYPDSATITFPSGAIEPYRTQPPRGYHGYITRRIGKGNWVGFDPHGDLFELSFPVVIGMSGAPLFLRHTQGLSFELIGVCLSSIPSEVAEYVHEEIQRDGRVERETRVKVEQYGLAQDLRPILDWKPQCLGGESLAAAIRSSFETTEASS